MIEALACGTPVIAWRCGSVPEVIEHGGTGFIVDDTGQADRRRAAHRRTSIAAPAADAFERRFTARRMAERYLEVYARARCGQRRTIAHASTSRANGQQLPQMPAN